ncbi:fibronectin type III domain-containing protein [Bacteroidales bacterium OttesenSCG-928-L03]|nr:fibronectin type III domain-containing protein [Bacteroidales bacterium OttesenSCG-928-L03]
MKQLTPIFLFILLFLSFFVYSCGYEDFFGDPEEPDYPPQEEINIDDITFLNSVCTDTEITVSWAPVKDVVRYELFLNDTVLVTDSVVKKSYEENYRFRIVNLRPDTEYKITVRCITSGLDVKNQAISERTRKSFVADIMSVSLDAFTYRDVSYRHFIKTQDGGYLLQGDYSRYGIRTFYFIKFNERFEQEWLTSLEPIADEGYITGVYESPSGEFLLHDERSIFVLDSQGNLLYRKKIRTEEGFSLQSGTVLPDGSFILIGSIFHYGAIRQYYISRFTAEGDLVWEHIGEMVSSDEDQYQLQRVLVPKSSDKVLVLGVLHQSFYVSETFSSLLLLELDVADGSSTEFLYDETSIPSYIFDINQASFVNDELYILGSVSIRPNGLYTTSPFIAKIGANKEFIWYREHFISSATGAFPSIDASHIDEDGSSFCVIGDDRGTGFAHIGSDGHLLSFAAGSNLPSGLYIEDRSETQIVYFTSGGMLVTINLDGYN